MKRDYFLFTARIHRQTHTALLTLTTKHIRKLRLDSSQSLISIEKSEEFSILQGFLEKLQQIEMYHKTSAIHFTEVAF